jgi:formylglycine-generating enzyme required for sulfatase activity
MLMASCGANALNGPATTDGDRATNGSAGTKGTDAVTSSGSDSGAASLPPSCAPGGPGLTDCGQHRENCCNSLQVIGGSYYRTYDLNVGSLPGDVPPPEGGSTTGEADPATISSFRMDEYDVTVGRFRQFVAAWSSGWTPAPGSGKHDHLNGGNGLADVGANVDPSAAAGTAYETGWLTSYNDKVAPIDGNLLCQGRPDFDSWTPSIGARENRPMNCVNWYEAYAFCIWDGGFLPSEAEYEYAAAGGNQQRAYPWGSTDPGAASQYAIFGDDQGNCYYPTGKLERCSGMSVAPVGMASSGAGLYGQLDLTGNVWQWMADWFHDYEQCTDCAYLTAPTPDFRRTAVPSRVLRGGSFSSSTDILLAPTRAAWASPDDRTLNDSFRCARVP